jgi:hypothetical protein
MLKKLLGLFATTAYAAANAQQKPSPAEEALLRQIAERSKTDPLIGAKIGSKEITQRLLAAMKSERGVHIESLLCALGSIAGYACQASVRAQAIARGLPETSLFTLVQTKNGKTFYFGDNLNKPLAESQYSVWSLAAGGAQQAGCKAPQSIDGIFKYVSETVGSEAFGKPRFPSGHAAQDLPLSYVKMLWPALSPTIKKFCLNPEHWPVLLGLSIQEIIGMGKQALDPCISLQIVMESAIPMSKVKLESP